MDIGTIATVLTIVATCIVIIGGFVMRDRQTHEKIRLAKEEAMAKSSASVAELHRRIDGVKDNYMRRDDHAQTVEHMMKPIEDVKDELVRTNKRLDDLLQAKANPTP